MRFWHMYIVSDDYAAMEVLLHHARRFKMDANLVYGFRRVDL